MFVAGQAAWDGHGCGAHSFVVIFDSFFGRSDPIDCCFFSSLPLLVQFFAFTFSGIFLFYSLGACV